MAVWSAGGVRSYGGGVKGARVMVTPGPALTGDIACLVADNIHQASLHAETSFQSLPTLLRHADAPGPPHPAASAAFLNGRRPSGVDLS